ncbi:LysE family translocator [Aneurinibacillus thermoaerophilus]|jgi:threonine/homoserine/homoserine lactone efflux protein|uniref:LysE family translocator n=1 Tax=Aneurinibacillus thermoaerophilus TaxID=143495 RepID=A0A1G7YWT8_ANETH|nr:MULTISPECIES: LysE family translocator [Aneurinibacillus]AMA73163.1 threonine transporter RhtB [Aneurinibacillus sp. XH2]MED0674416.1 LysE family translocator [Aneurinibacillus thermoaerophilus]MED0678433.1 LysE family translocator [Aneurinibacillus thermoaerophilus]MED0758959.1 LysE family translocator [Aneurinibacillus thermoaerophilus]MED0761015.1 LysE family translocator [Aneurinibacillus thermoaerophilus]
MEISHVLYFAAVSAMLTLAPGPDILFVITQSVSQGKKAGIATALGLCSGVTVHTLAAAFGISAILYQSTVAFQALKYAGACYLLYLAWQAFKEKDAPLLPVEAITEYKLGALYRRGILMNVLNPKVSLFFLAFLPQFVTPGAGNNALQMIVLGFVFMIQAIIIFSVVALLSGSVGQKILHNATISKYVNLAKAIIFSLIGIQLALSEK